MKLIYDLDELYQEEMPKEKWTVIIPAAGKGSRLGYHAPKILFPILGKPILYWLVDLLDIFCEKFVFVLSPEGEEAVSQKLEEYIPGRFQVTIQSEAKGMADAVLQSKEFVLSGNCIVVWGDQVTLASNTLRACIGVHEKNKNVLLTLPTVLKKEPYIHFRRNENGYIDYVYQKREENIPVEIGESDCGLFLFNTHKLFEILEENRNNPSAYGKSTEEYNLLPLIPLFENNGGSLLTVRLKNQEETLGVNSREDADLAAEILQNRSAKE